MLVQLAPFCNSDPGSASSSATFNGRGKFPQVEQTFSFLFFSFSCLKRLPGILLCVPRVSRVSVWHSNPMVRSDAFRTWALQIDIAWHQICTTRTNTYIRIPKDSTKIVNSRNPFAEYLVGGIPIRTNIRSMFFNTYERVFVPRMNITFIPVFLRGNIRKNGWIFAPCFLRSYSSTDEYHTMNECSPPCLLKGYSSTEESRSTPQPEREANQRIQIPLRTFHIRTHELMSMTFPKSHTKTQITSIIFRDKSCGGGAHN